MAELLKPSDLAAIKGVSRAAVHEAMKVRIAAAVVMVKGKRMVDRDLALELWDRNTQRDHKSVIGVPGKQPRQPKPAPAAAVAVDVEAAAPTDQQLRMFIQGLPEDQIPDLNDSRARYEHYKAEKARLEALQGRGELVTAADVKAEAFACGRAVRDALLGLADRLAPILAATMDARECHRLLTEEHRIALRSLADG